MTQLGTASSVFFLFGAFYVATALLLNAAVPKATWLRAVAAGNTKTQVRSFSTEYLLSGSLSARLPLPIFLVPFATVAIVFLVGVGAFAVLYYVGIAPSIAFICGFVLVLPALDSVEGYIYFRGASRAMGRLERRDLPYMSYFSRWLRVGAVYFSIVGGAAFLVGASLPSVLRAVLVALAAYIQPFFWAGSGLFSLSPYLGIGLGLVTVASSVPLLWLLGKLILALAGRIVDRALRLSGEF